MIDKELQEIVLLAQKIIKDYLWYVDDEKKELIDIIFKRTPVMYGDIESNARAVHDKEDRKIIINQIYKYNYERVLSFLIHEYAHMFMERNYEFENELLPHWIGEGVADTFSDLVINNYFKNHTEKISEQVLNFELPYVSYSAYIFENSFVRTLLYPLEKNGTDKEAIEEILLGSPKKFIEMITSKEFSEQIEYNTVGVPKSVDISIDYMYLNKQEDYEDIDKKSIYYLKNAILPMFKINEKISAEDPSTRPHELAKDDLLYNSIFIEQTYFKNKKLYQINPNELEEFLEIYEKSKMPQLKFFAVDSYVKYMDNQFMYLLENEEEIITNCDSLFDNIPYFINNEVTQIGSNMYRVIAICLKQIMSKINNLEFNNIYAGEVYYKLKNIIIPRYKNLSQKDDSQNCAFLIELFEDMLNNIGKNIIPIDDRINEVDKDKAENSGTSKQCYNLGDVILLKGNFEFNQDNYYFNNMLNNMGIKTPRVIAMQKKKDTNYVLEERVEGQPIQEYIPNKIYPMNTTEDIVNNYSIEKEYVRKYLDRLKELSEKPNVLGKFADDYFSILENGGFVDPSKTTNFIYNEKGISFIDINLRKNKTPINDYYYVFHYIMYIISWCHSDCFTEEEAKEENEYLNKILDILKNTCTKMNLNVDSFVVNLDNEPLSKDIEKRFEFRKQYGISSEKDYIEKESEYLEANKKTA